MQAADTEMKEAAAEEVAPVKAEGGEEGEAAGAVEGDAKEEEELAEGEGSPDKGAGCGKKGRTTRGRGRGRAARGRGRKVGVLCSVGGTKCCLGPGCLRVSDMIHICSRMI